MATKESYDAIIIGGGHNGLTCAGYLAAKGKSVKVLERRHIVGGAAVTEEIIPDFRNSTCSYAMSLLHPKIIADLELEKYGLQIHKEEHTMLVMSENDHLFLSDKTFVDELARHHPDDLEGYEKLHDTIEAIADVLREVAFETPPNLGGGLMDLWRAGKLANHLRKLSPELQAETYRMFTMSIRDFLKRYIKGDLMQVVMAHSSQVGTLQSVDSGGTAYVLLHHMFGIVNDIKGEYAHIHGGMGSISNAMAASAKARGVDIEVNAAVATVIVENQKAVGVTLEDGREIRAKIVASNINPKLLFAKMLDEKHVPELFTRQIKDYRCHSATFRMNVALDELPKWNCLADHDNYKEVVQGSMIIGSSLDQYQQAYEDALKYGWSRKPILQMMIPSVIDDSLAPEGKHVMSLFCQHFMYLLPDGRSWDDAKEEVADYIIDWVDQHCSNFKKAVIGRKVLSPLDLEREYGLLGGDIFHGSVVPDQLFSMRPVPGYADYRMPVKGLYLCGSGAHPGGGVSGIPGHNAAREILRDI